MSTETIFVSYSSKDRPFVLAFVEELKSFGAKIWIDQLDIELGENWDNAIEEALEKSETIMIIISPTSVESQNVQDEVSIAISTKKKMVPILIRPCELPMRWGRRQYADLASNPDKAINDILHFLGLQEKAANGIKKLLNLIGVSEAPKKVVRRIKKESSEEEVDHEIVLEDLLISNEEIERAKQMHNKGIKKNWKMIVIVAIISVMIFLLLSFTNLITVPFWIAIVGSLALNLLSINPYGAIKKRERYIDLMDLLKLKRERLTRVVNRLSDTDIEKFNTEFYSYVKI